MNKVKSIFVVAVIALAAILFTGCADANNGAIPMEPTYSLNVVITWEQEMEMPSGASPAGDYAGDLPPIPSTPNSFINQYPLLYMDMPSKSSYISQDTLDSLTEKLADYGLTVATGKEGWYSDQDCRQKVSAGDLVENNAKGDSMFHNYTIYARVKEDVSKLYSYYAVVDSEERYEYSQIGGGEGIQILMPKSPTTEEMTELLKQRYSGATLGSVKIRKGNNNGQPEYDTWEEGDDVQKKMFILAASEKFDDLGVYFVNVEYQTGIVADLQHTSFTIPKAGIKVSKLLSEDMFKEITSDRCVIRIEGKDEAGNTTYEDITQDTVIKPYDEIIVYFGLVSVCCSVKNGNNYYEIHDLTVSLPATASFDGEGVNETKYATLVQSDLDLLWAKLKDYGFTRDETNKVSYSFNSHMDDGFAPSEFTPGTTKWSRSDMIRTYGSVYIYFDVTDDCGDGKLTTQFINVDSNGREGDVINNQFFFHKIITADEVKQTDRLVDYMQFNVPATIVDVYESYEDSPESQIRVYKNPVTAGETQPWGKKFYVMWNKTFEELGYNIYFFWINYGDNWMRESFISDSSSVNVSRDGFLMAFPNDLYRFGPMDLDCSIKVYTNKPGEEGSSEVTTTLEPFKDYFIDIVYNSPSPEPDSEPTI